MTYRWVYRFAVLLAVLGATACPKAEEKPYCFGVNETNMPPRIVLVENAREATRYRLNERDVRLLLPPSLVVGEANENLLVESESPCVEQSALGCYDVGIPSCGEIDPFADLDTIEITGVERVDGVYSRRGECGLLYFSAEMNNGDLVMNWTPGLVGREFYNMQSFVSSMCGANEIALDGWGAVSVSFVYRAERHGYRATKDPLEKELLYTQDTPDGSPPLMVTRVWRFENTPENAEFKDFLGIESDEPYFACGDLYFGYFAR